MTPLDQMADMFSRGKSFAAIARTLGIDKETVQRQLEDSNHPGLRLTTPKRIDILVNRMDEMEAEMATIRSLLEQLISEKE